MTSNDIMAFLSEKAFPYYEIGGPYEKHSWQDRFFTAFLQSLPEELLEGIMPQLDELSGCPYLLRAKARRILSVKEESGRPFISTPALLRLYEDKNSGKVSMAARELLRRFRSESEERRRAILRAFLRGGKREMEWAGRWLRYNWSGSLSKLVAERWRATHNHYLGLAVLRHMPASFLLEEQEALADAVGYDLVWGRIGNKKGFRLDGGGLTVPEHFYVTAKLGTGASRAINVPAVLEFMLGEYLDEEDRIPPDDLERILWSMGRIGMTDALTRLFPELEKRERQEKERERLLFGD